MGGHYSKVPHYFLSLALLRFRHQCYIPSIPRVSVIRANQPPIIIASSARIVLLIGKERERREDHQSKPKQVWQLTLLANCSHYNLLLPYQLKTIAQFFLSSLLPYFLLNCMSIQGRSGIRLILFHVYQSCRSKIRNCIFAFSGVQYRNRFDDKRPRHRAEEHSASSFISLSRYFQASLSLNQYIIDNFLIFCAALSVNKHLKHVIPLHPSSSFRLHEALRMQETSERHHG